MAASSVGCARAALEGDGPPASGSLSEHGAVSTNAVESTPAPSTPSTPATPPAQPPTQSRQVRSVYFMGGSGCSWREHWYFSVAAAVKATLGRSVRCVLCYMSPEVADTSDPEQLAWLHQFHDPSGDDREGCWRARLLRRMGAGAEPTDVVVGHSAGGNAALRVAERTRLGGLVLVGAGWTPVGRADDARARQDPSYRAAQPWTVIEPWQYAAIVANVPWVVLLHGPTDPIIPVSEGAAIYTGLVDAAALRAAAGLPTATIELLQPASLAHAQVEHCPLVLEVLLARLAASVA